MIVFFEQSLNQTVVQILVNFLQFKPLVIRFSVLSQSLILIKFIVCIDLVNKYCRQPVTIYSGTFFIQTPWDQR